MNVIATIPSDDENPGCLVVIDCQRVRDRWKYTLSRAEKWKHTNYHANIKIIEKSVEHLGLGGGIWMEKNTYTHYAFEALMRSGMPMHAFTFESTRSKEILLTALTYAVNSEELKIGVPVEFLTDPTGTMKLTMSLAWFGRPQNRPEAGMYY